MKVKSKGKRKNGLEIEKGEREIFGVKEEGRKVGYDRGKGDRD